MPAVAPVNAAAEEACKRFGLEAIPENVRRFTQLVARQEASTGEIAKIISQDKTLIARLLRAANPRAESEADYAITDVEEALQRTGVGCVMLLAMADPLARAVQKTFVTMLGIELKQLSAAAVESFEGEHVLSTVAFDGKATGRVSLRYLPETARVLAAHILGVSTGEVGGNADVDDVVGELSNIVVGNFKSNLCDAGLACKLSTPSISRTETFQLGRLIGGFAERMAFRAPDLSVFVDITVNPWSH